MGTGEGGVRTGIPVRRGLPWVVLPGFSWVTVLRPVWDRGPSHRATAEEGDGGLEVFPIPVTARPPFDGHDLAVESLGRAVGDPMPAKGQDVVQVSGEHDDLTVSHVLVREIAGIDFNRLREKTVTKFITALTKVRITSDHPPNWSQAY